MRFFKKLFHRHKDYEIIRWHYTHGPNGNDPIFIEIECRCRECGEILYRYVTENMDKFESKYADKKATTTLASKKLL